MSRNNANNPCITVIELGSRTADATLPVIYFPKKSRIKSAHLINGATVAGEDEVNKMAFSLKDQDDNVYASLDTEDDGDVTANVAKALTVSENDVPAGTTLKLAYDESEGQSEVTRIVCAAIAGKDEKFFQLNDEDGSVGVWIDENGGASAPAGATALDRQIEIPGVGTEDAEELATLIAATLDADSKFSAEVDAENPTHVLVTLVAKQDVDDAVDGDTGFTITTETQGVDVVAQALTNAKLQIEHFPA